MNTSLLDRHDVSISGDPGGPTLVLAHGFGCDQNMWNRVRDRLAETCRVVVFDHAGAGRSDPNAYDVERHSSLEGYAQDVSELCREVSERPVHLVGHSVSAAIAVFAAIAEPELFASLVLVAPSPSYLDDPSDGYRGGFTSADIDGLLVSLDANYFAWAAAIAPMVMGNPEQPRLAGELEGSFCRTDPGIARRFAQVTFRSDWRNRLGELHVPSLILQCSDDALAPIEVGDYLHRHLQGSTLKHLEATGHCPHVSAPQETADAILAYVHGVD